MYRDTQTLPGGGFTLLGIIVLSFLTPGWAANALGCLAAHAHLLDLIFRQQGILFIVLLLLYGLGGFTILVAAAVGVFTAGIALMRALATVKAWGVRASVATAWLLGELLRWPVQVLCELLWDAIQQHVVQRYVAPPVAWLHEQGELRRIYREEYAADFPSFRAFLRSWRAHQQGEQAASETDQLQKAIRLMGLPKNFTKDDLIQRFHKLIAGIHPDKVGPNELATQLIDAYKLIFSREAWQ
jgi:hypothetical protein